MLSQSCQGKFVMRKQLIAIVATAVALEVLLLSASPAFAITVELAKKCRTLAIAAHPTQLAGASAYAAAQRDFFNQCVAKNGDVGSGNPNGNNAPPAKSN
jgi:hypothetical protein